MIIIILFVAMLLFGFQEVRCQQWKSHRTIFILLSIIWCLLPAIRNENVGTDTMNYIYFFQHPQLGYNGKDEVELGFECWNLIVRSISNNKYFYLFSTALLATIPMVWVIYKISSKPLLTLCLISTIVLLEPFVFSEYGAMRQSLSIGFFMVFYYLFVLKNKLYLSIVFGILSFLFHNSSLLPLMVVMVLSFVHLQISKRSAYTILVISFFLGNVSVFYLKDFFMTVSTIIQIGQIGYLEHIDTTELADGYGYYRNVLPLCLYAIFSLYYYNDEFITDPLLKITVATVVLTNIFITIPIGQRITYALVPLLCLTVSNSINRYNFKYIIPVILFEFYRLYNYYQAQALGIQGNSNGNIIFPYNTFLF